jgi:hypothetical protein
MINFVGPTVSLDNPELRTEALTWIIKYKDSIKTSDVQSLVKPLVACLSDKTPAIRGLAE